MIYTKLTKAEEVLKSYLGISTLDYTRREELEFYQWRILEYLGDRLILLGSDDIKARVEEVYNIFSSGADLICNQGTLDLIRRIGGIDTSDPRYDQDRFVFSWTNILSTLCLRLGFQYAYLFKQQESGECCTCGMPGETTKDYESWTSGAYPEDEEYDRSNYTRSNTPWEISKSRPCDCYRHGDGE